MERAFTIRFYAARKCSVRNCQEMTNTAICEPLEQGSFRADPVCNRHGYYFISNTAPGGEEIREQYTIITRMLIAYYHHADKAEVIRSVQDFSEIPAYRSTKRNDSTLDVDDMAWLCKIGQNQQEQAVYAVWSSNYQRWMHYPAQRKREEANV